MGFWANIFRARDRAAEQKQSVYERWLTLLEDGRQTKSGNYVSWERALQVSTVLCCVRVIAEGVAQVPLKLFRESPDGKTRLPAREHPLYTVLHLQANAWQTSFEWRETTSIHAGLCGNAYSYLARYRGAVAEMVPFEPQSVRVKRDTRGVLVGYDVTAGGETKTFAPRDILHTRGPSWDACCGLEAVKLAREAIGLALATEETHAQFHQNGARPSGVLSVEGQLTKEQYDQLYTWLAKAVGAKNAGVPLIVDRAAKWVAQSMTGVDAQHLETRLHQVREICAFFRVMPLMVGYTDKASTYASAEQMFLAHVVHTLAPWYERIEQRLNVQVLTEADRRDGLYVKFIEEGLLRGAMKDTADYLVRLTTNGILTRNEARAKLDENPLDGLDEPLTPVNLTGQSAQAAEEERQMQQEEARAAQFKSMQEWLTRIDERLAKPAAPPQFTLNAPITVETPDVKVSNHLPEQTAPTVDVKVDAHMPEQRAPDVHAHFEAHLPEVKAPDVTVNVKNEVPPAEVNVHLPPRKTKTEVERDRDGNLVRATQIETDL